MRGTQTQSAKAILGSEVRERRQELGWSQTKLGEVMGTNGVPMTAQLIAKLESASRPTTVDELLALAQSFGCTVAELVQPVDEAYGLEGYPVKIGRLRQALEAKGTLSEDEIGPAPIWMAQWLEKADEAARTSLATYEDLQRQKAESDDLRVRIAELAEQVLGLAKAREVES